MVGMVRHPWIVGLGQIVDAGRFHGRQQLFHSALLILTTKFAKSVKYSLPV